MPAGVSWGTYFRYLFLGFGSMFLGSQLVFTIYKPLDDLDQLVDAKIRELETKQEKES